MIHPVDVVNHFQIGQLVVTIAPVQTRVLVKVRIGAILGKIIMWITPILEILIVVMVLVFVVVSSQLHVVHVIIQACHVHLIEKFSDPNCCYPWFLDYELTNLNFECVEIIVNLKDDDFFNWASSGWPDLG
jgi:hypothetical protein